MHAARAEARRYADLNPPPQTDPAEALNWLLGRLMDEARYFAMKVDGLKEDELETMTAFGPIDHHYIRAQSRVTKELASLCVNMERVGLAERMVRLQEARAMLIIRALTEAAVEAGISRAKLKEIGPAFRERLQLLEGGAATQPAPRPSGRRAA